MGSKKIIKVGDLNAELLKESFLYQEDITERMFPKYEDDILNNNTSLGDSPCFPVGDERNFLTKIMNDRFSKIVKKSRKAFDVDELNDVDIEKLLTDVLFETTSMESTIINDLESLAVDFIKKEFNIVDEVEFDVEITSKELDDNTINDTPDSNLDIEFDDHNQIVYAKDSVYKRRFVNALIDGASKRVINNISKLESEIIDLNPRLFNNYDKIISGSDYLLFTISDDNDTVDGGSVELDLSGEKPKVIAKGMILPILINQLSKGCMLILSNNGLPKNDKVLKYVLNKSDFKQAENWDSRIGLGLWDKLCDSIPKDEFKIKEYVYSDLVSLEPIEFFNIMKEVLGGTKLGKSKISELIDKTKDTLSDDGDSYFSIDELI